PGHRKMSFPKTRSASHIARADDGHSRWWPCAQEKTLPPPGDRAFKVFLPSRASSGCGSVKQRLVLGAFGQLVADLPKLVGDGFCRAFVGQAFTPQSVEPEIKTAVHHGCLITERRRARYPYKYQLRRRARRNLRCAPFRIEGQVGARSGSGALAR